MKKSLLMFSMILLLLVSCGSNSNNASGSSSGVISAKYRNLEVDNLANKIDELGVVDVPENATLNSYKLNESYGSDGLDITIPNYSLANTDGMLFFTNMLEKANSIYDLCIEKKNSILNHNQYLNKWKKDEYTESSNNVTITSGTRITYKRDLNSLVLEEYVNSATPDSNRHVMIDGYKSTGEYISVYVDDKSGVIHYKYSYIRWIDDSIVKQQLIDYKEDDYCRLFDIEILDSDGSDLGKGKAGEIVSKENCSYYDIDLDGDSPIYYGVSYSDYLGPNGQVVFEAGPGISMVWEDYNGINIYDYSDDSKSPKKFYKNNTIQLDGVNNSFECSLYALSGIKNITLYDYVQDETRWNANWKITFENGDSTSYRGAQTPSSNNFYVDQNKDGYDPRLLLGTANRNEIYTFFNTYGLTFKEKDTFFSYFDDSYMFNNILMRDLPTVLKNKLANAILENSVSDFATLIADYDNVNEKVELFNYDIAYETIGTIKVSNNLMDLSGFNFKIKKLAYTVNNITEDFTAESVDIYINNKLIGTYQLKNNEIDISSNSQVNLDKYNLDYSNLKIQVVILNTIKINIK